MNYQEAIDKAMKLLRLSKSPVPAEAALAAAKAQEIIDRYKLDVTGIDYEKQESERDNEQVKDYGYGDPLESVKYLKPWMLYLCHYVARANQCRILYVKSDVLGDGRNRGAVIKVIGHPSNVAAVRYLHSYLRNEVERLRDAQCIGNSGTYKRQFCLGVVQTIWQKLNEQQQATRQDVRAKAGANSTALVLVDRAIAKIDKREAEVEAYVKSLIGDSKGRGGVTGGGHGSGAVDARAHGRKAGEAIKITQAKGSLGSGTKQLN